MNKNKELKRKKSLIIKDLDLYYKKTFKHEVKR